MKGLNWRIELFLVESLRFGIGSTIGGVSRDGG